MKNKKYLSLTITLSIIFIIWTVVSLFIVYLDLDSQISYYIVLVYAFFAFFMLIYIILTTLINSRRLEWNDLKKKIIIFIIIFLFSSTINYGIDYMFRPEKLDLLRIFSSSFGVAFTFSFIDLIFMKDKKEKSFR